MADKTTKVLSFLLGSATVVLIYCVYCFFKVIEGLTHKG